MSRRKSGDGTFKKTKSGKIEMRKMHGYLPNGTPRILQVTGTSETDCKRKMRIKEEEFDRKFLTNYNNGAKKITLSELCYAHLNQHKAEEKRLKASSADRRACTIRNQVEPYPIGRLQALTVTSMDIRNHIEYLIHEGQSVSNVEKALNIMNGAYKWACDQCIFNYNPCTPVKDSLNNRLANLSIRNSSDGVVVVLAEEQIQKIRNYVLQKKDKNNKDDRFYYKVALWILFLIETGMRIGELCALRWKDYSRVSNTLVISKTREVVEDDRKQSGKRYIVIENEVKNSHSRTICLSDNAIHIMNEIYELSNCRDMDDYIILNEVKKPTNPRNAGPNINRVYAELDFPDHISGAHVLRRTCATQMYNQGCSIDDIAAYLGDTPETIRKHYVSVTKRIIVGDEVLNVVPFPTKK